MKSQEIAVLAGLSLLIGSAAIAAPRQATHSAVVVMPSSPVSNIYGASPTPPPTSNAAIKTFVDLRSTADPVRCDANFVYYVLDPPNSLYTEARSINSSGEIVGYYHPLFSSQIEGFLLQNNNYTPIVIAGVTNIFPMRIGDDGTIVGTATDADGRFHGVVIRGSQYEEVDDPGLPNTVITGINDKDEYVGYGFDTPGTVTSFSGKVNVAGLTPLNVAATIWDVNDKNDLVGNQVRGEAKAADATPVDNNTSEHDSALVIADQVAKQINVAGTTKAYGINNNDDIVGIYSDPHGFVVHNGAIINFDVPGSEGTIGTQAYGVNDADWIVGVFEEQGSDSRPDVVHGFLAVPKADGE